jgi:hypothetical protein
LFGFLGRLVAGTRRRTFATAILTLDTESGSWKIGLAVGCLRRDIGGWWEVRCRQTPQNRRGIVPGSAFCKSGNIKERFSCPEATEYSSDPTGVLLTAWWGFTSVVPGLYSTNQSDPHLKLPHSARAALAHRKSSTNLALIDLDSIRMGRWMIAAGCDPAPPERACGSGSRSLPLPSLRPSHSDSTPCGYGIKIDFGAVLKVWHKDTATGLVPLSKLTVW